jgi:proteic killer suppression protein
MIASFGDAETEALYNGRSARFPPNIRKVGKRKLDMVEAAHDLRDLKAPPGNRLEALSGTLQGRHSIRVNDQWRVIFRWEGGNAHEVRIVDYH